MTEPIDHRRPAVALFNETWRLMEQPDRTPADARAEIEQALAVPIAEDEDRSLLLADLATVPGVDRFW